MLDQLLELLERDESKGRQNPGGRRSLSDRLFGRSKTDDAEVRQEDDRATDDRQDDDTRPKQKPSKRDRLADLFEME